MDLEIVFHHLIIQGCFDKLLLFILQIRMTCHTFYDEFNIEYILSVIKRRKETKIKKDLKMTHALANLLFSYVTEKTHIPETLYPSVIMLMEQGANCHTNTINNVKPLLDMIINGDVMMLKIFMAYNDVDMLLKGFVNMFGNKNFFPCPLWYILERDNVLNRKEMLKFFLPMLTEYLRKKNLSLKTDITKYAWYGKNFYRYKTLEEAEKAIL